MKKIELLLAYEDGTWTTEIIDCPDELDRNDFNAVQDWMAKELYRQTQYRTVILFSVYDTEPQEDRCQYCDNRLESGQIACEPDCKGG